MFGWKFLRFKPRINRFRLTSLIEKTKEVVSRNYTDLAVGILFKYSGALLRIQEDTDSEVLRICSCMAVIGVNSILYEEVPKQHLFLFYFLFFYCKFLE